MNNFVAFGLFSDFHYKKGMYSATVDDLRSIFNRAKKVGAQFMVHCGDFCNDYKGSPEIVKEYLENNCSLPVYGAYGNHDLETADNSMEYVTPLLTNDKNVTWGTPDGKIGDGSIGYYYVDRCGYRLILTDTNYSFSPEKGVWEHNRTGSYCPPENNLFGYSLGTAQFVWLEELLIRSAREEKSCIIIGHGSFAGKFHSATPDAEAMRNLFARANAVRGGTVIMAVNGHFHTNHMEIVDDVLYVDMNSTRNALWKADGAPHYKDGHTYEYADYDGKGNFIECYKRNLSELSMAQNTCVTSDPLSAVATISDDGKITIDGTESSWAYGVIPDGGVSGTAPRVSSYGI